MSLEIALVAPDLYPLVNRFYRQYQRGIKANRQHQVWVGKELGQIVCCLCLQPVSHGHWLTSLLVAPQHRQRRHASALLAKVVEHYQGPIWLFCAPQLAAFYAQTGFTPLASLNSLPEALADRLTRYQRQKSLIALVIE